jgi:group I intron endonuclease
MFVYKITNEVNGKSYIGRTARSLKARFLEHCSASSQCLLLHRAIVKYGRDNFSIIALGEARDSDELNRLEQSFIIEYGTLAPNGYNLTTGGDAPQHSAETKAKMSRSHKGKVFTDEHRENLSRTHRGLKQNRTPLWNARIAEANRYAHLNRDNTPYQDGAYRAKQSEITSEIWRLRRLGLMPMPQRRS